MEMNPGQFNRLIEEVSKRRIKYEDFYEIAAYLESIGWNDHRVFEAFGAKNIFELAEQIYEIINKKALSSAYIPPKKKNFFLFFYNALKNFLRGLIFALPMAISVVSMLTLRFSLWSYENLSTEIATSIAIGTILSFMTIGGFTQAIARRGFFYLILGYYNLARNITFTFVRLGYLTIFIIALILFASSAIFQFFPYRMLIIAVLYYIFLSSIWLSVTVMYILRKELAFTGLIILGILIVYVFFVILHYNIILSQLISLFIVTFCCLFLTILFFKNAEKKMEKGIAPKQPKLSVTLYIVLPYFVYGFLYFTFLYIDRIIAWSANNSIYMPYIVWFRGHYELGLDFALFTLMVPMGIIEVVIDNIMKKIEVEEYNYTINNVDKMNSLFKKSYRKSLVGMILFSFVSSVIIYIVLRYIDANYSDVLRFRIFSNPTIHFVLLCALLSYSILSAALMNAVLLFALAQPKMINKVLAAAMAINIAVGFAASRWSNWWADNVTHTTGIYGIEGYSFAVLGLIAGSIYFLVTSIRLVLNVLGKLDYYLYAIS